MKTQPTCWYSFSEQGSNVLRCAACAAVTDAEVARLDHHLRVCPACGVECVYLSWKDCHVQIILPRAPVVLTQTIRLAQQHFDELEYVELMGSLEQLMDDFYALALARACS